MKKLKALLIDDDKQFCQSFSALSEEKFDLRITHNGKSGLAELKKSSPDVVFLDYKLGRGMNGLDVLEKIVELNPDLPVIMITDYAEVDIAVEAMKKGAFHYTSKSPNIEALNLIIEKQIEQINWKLLYRESEERKHKVMIAVSPSMQPVLEQIRTIAPQKSTVLIYGESGVGKEVCAREIHRLSQRADKPFVTINCSTLTPLLFESEFFGYEPGAFTSAEKQKKGKLELADQSTIFLDEIGDLPLESQAKILRAIEEQQFERLGGTETHPVDVRIIAATNRELTKLVEEKKFREDLFYRLSVINIRIPQLKERIEDIPPLVELFINRFAKIMSKQAPAVSDNAIEKLKAYPWPGNIRELKNIIERIVAFHKDNSEITADEIQLTTNTPKTNYQPHLFELTYEQAKHKLLNDFFKIYFQRALERNNGNISETAKEVGLNRSSLHKLLRDLGLQ